MKVRKAIKKIMALGAGVVMMGATILGASAAAADLADYPSMFIDNGKFNGYFVVGANAASSDVVGITNIGMRMQYDAKKTSYVSTGGESVTSIDNGIKFDKTSDHLYLGEDISSIHTKLDSTDMPSLLADGNYDESEGNNDNDEDYDQEITFGGTTGLVTWAQDDQDAPTAGWYLYFDKSHAMYTYTLTFDNPIDFDSSAISADFEGTELEMQGHTYSILDANDDGSHHLDKLDLMAGETLIWLQQGETVTRMIDGTEHEIEMVDVTENEDACGLKVDGSTVWIDQGDSDTTNGVTIGVIDAKAVHTVDYDADICKVNLGSSELVLEDGNEVKLNGNNIDGSLVSFDQSTNDKLGSITISYTPDDEVFLSSGEEVTDPVFGNFKFVVGDTVGVSEDITFSASGDEGELVFTNNDGREVTVPLYDDGSVGQPYLGDGDQVDDQVYINGQTCAPSSSDVTDCEGARFMAVSNGEVHIYEIKNIDTHDHQIDFKDLTYDSNDNDNDYTAEAVTTFSLGVGNVDLNISEADGKVKFNDIGDESTVETNYEGILDFSNAGTITFIEKDDPVGISGATDIDYGQNAAGGTDDELEFDVAADWDNLYAVTDFDKDNNDDRWHVSAKGSTMLVDEDKDQDITLTHYEEAAYLEVYFAPTSAEVTAGSDSGDVETMTPQQIAVQAVKLDSEVSNVLGVNAVVVGGPCVNTAAAALMGNPANCAEGFTEGHAKIKLFENNGMVQVLVAGYNADDSRRAANVLAQYENYATLKGDEVDVTGTSLTDITVDEPMEMPAEPEPSEPTA